MEKLLRTAVKSKDFENEIKKRIEKNNILDYFTEEEINNIIKDEKRKQEEKEKKKSEEDLRTAVQLKKSEDEIKKCIEKNNILDYFTEEEINNIIKDEKIKQEKKEKKVKEEELKIRWENLLRLSIDVKDSKEEMNELIQRYSMLDYFTEEEINCIIKDEKRKMLEEK